MNLLAKSNKTDPNYPTKLKRLKSLDVGGPLLLTEPEVRKIKQLYQFVKRHKNYTQSKRGFNGLLTRLKWNNHFIQKFENKE